MESIFATIASITAAFKGIDWGAFFLWWLGIERLLKAIATITPWKWDDDLVAAVSRAVSGLKKPNA